MKIQIRDASAIHPVQVSKENHLMVCLHNVESIPIPDYPFGTCPECENAVPLIDLIRNDTNLLLHYRDENDEIKPLRPEIIKGE